MPNPEQGGPSAEDMGLTPENGSFETKQENKKGAGVEFYTGDRVAILRPNGEVETDWILKDGLGPNFTVIVEKKSSTGEILQETPALAEFTRWQEIYMKDELSPGKPKAVLQREQRAKDLEEWKIEDIKRSADLLKRFMKDGQYSETLDINEKGKLSWVDDEATRIFTIARFVEGEEGPEDLMKLFKDIEDNVPDLHFEVERDPEGKWIKF